jgi:hypothetical protein
MWKRANVGNKGILGGKELEKFRSVLNTVDTNKDGKISQSEFMTACQQGELKTPSSNDDKGMINSQTRPSNRGLFVGFSDNAQQGPHGWMILASNLKALALHFRLDG